MESANLYEHQHQQQLQPQLLYSSNNLPSSSSSSSSSSASSSSSPSLGVSALHDWNPSTVVLDGYHDELNRYMTEILPNSPSVRSRSLQEMRFGHVIVHPPLINNELQFDHEINLNNGSISDNNFLKLSDDMNSYDQDVMVDLNHKFSWLSNTFPKQNGESFASAAARFGAHPPAASSSVLSSSSSPSLQLSADHYNILGYTNNYNNKMEGSNQFFEERNSLTYFQVHQSSHSPSTSSNKTSKFRNAEASRTEKLSAASSSSSTVHDDQVVAKRPRLSSSSPTPTLKVRKEKLGDRIAALHRMVSPFGKTDTASVLTEAIGYIQFLQDQIQTLTMSYLKSSRSKARRNVRGDSRTNDDHHHHHQKPEDDPKTNQDLRSRGLCLVPLSFTSYICSYNGNI